jgi:hypothetical protein
MLSNFFWYSGEIPENLFSRVLKKTFGQFGFVFLPYHVGQIIKAERNFTCAQNFGHSGKP